MKQLEVSVLRDASIGDCTNNGITSRHDELTLFFDCSKDEALKYCSENNIDLDTVLWFNPRELWGEFHPFAEPLVKPPHKVGGMMGGNFIFTSDSRFPSLYGKCAHFPIPVHDRFETQEEYNALCL